MIRRDRRGIRFRLLLWVNLVLGSATAVLLVADYRQERADQLARVAAALEEEAKTLRPGVRRMCDSGLEAVQEYVDAVCGRMQESTSPGHHIAVRIGTKFVQAHAHHRQSSEILQAMQRAAGLPDRRAAFGGDDLVVGFDRGPEVAVYVSELASNVLARARERSLQRAAVVALLGLAAALIVNLLLGRLVVRPVRHLVGTVHAIGEGRLEERAPVTRSREMHFLATAINGMGASLLHEQERRRESLDRAARIQSRLNSLAPPPPGIRLAHEHRSADEIGGDYYDLLPLDDGSAVLCLADVSGHGVPAALEASMLKALLMTAVERESRLEAILEAANRRFEAVTLEAEFATMALVRLDPGARRFLYASAGHVDLIHLAPDGSVGTIGPTGMVLGVRADASWSVEERAVGPGARILLVTDGVTETRSAERELFGLERVARLFGEARAEPLERAVERLRLALDEWRGGDAPEDDETILALEFGVPDR